MIKVIKYKKRKIKVIWEKEPGCYAIYDPDANILKIDPKL